MTLLLWYSPHFCIQESLKPFLETLNTTLQRQNVSERLLKENENHMSIKVSKIIDFVETSILALRSPLMRSVTEFRRPLAGMAAPTLLLFGHSARAQPGLCQSYEAAFNLEAGMRDGLTLKQAIASILDDGYTDGSAACFAATRNGLGCLLDLVPLGSFPDVAAPGSLERFSPIDVDVVLRPVAGGCRPKALEWPIDGGSAAGSRRRTDRPGH